VKGKLTFTSHISQRTGRLALSRAGIVILASLLAFAGCGGGQDEGRDGKANAAGAQLNVVSTTGMIHDLVVNIGGEHVQATSLMGPGIDPHLYKASEGDVRRLTDANLIF